jgi:EAL domain-containing protein (putative c-di-GMP-specific phosphodiesterase class I)
VETIQGYYFSKPVPANDVPSVTARIEGAKKLALA